MNQNMQNQTTIKEPRKTEIKSTYSVLSESAMQYSSEVLLTEDFNARTQNRQCDTMTWKTQKQRIQYL